MVQMHAFYVFLGAAGLLTAVFLYVALSTRNASDINISDRLQFAEGTFYCRARRALLGHGHDARKNALPHNELPDNVVFVVGKQFSFALSDAPITNDQEYEARTYGTPGQVPAGSLIEFRVTSFDVTHSFAVYSPDDHLLAQTHAMPGYVNRLRVRFAEPGRHYVLCLELCGMRHHRMRRVFDVN